MGVMYTGDKIVADALLRLVQQSVTKKFYVSVENKRQDAPCNRIYYSKVY
jgi:hypothetical protein